jgi:ELWxxDGT repeat protein
MLKKSLLAQALLSATLVLTGCGGGSGGGSSDPETTPPVTTPPVTTPPVTTPPVTTPPVTTPPVTTPPVTTVPVTPTNSFHLFSANSGVNTGVELWKTDGTAAGTVLVKDINSAEGSDPLGLIRTDIDKWFFTAKDDTHGREIWVSDGTEAGTKIVKDIRAGASSSRPGKMTPFKDGVVFSLFTSVFPAAGSKLWFTDGTDAGTDNKIRLLPSGVAENPQNFTVVGDQLFFTASGPQGHELYITDGTGANTLLVKDLQPGVVPGSSVQLSGNLQYVTAFNNGVFFTAPVPVDPATASGPSTNLEPWFSGGDNSSTNVLKNINPGTAGSFPSGWTVSGDRLYFFANNGTDGTALWATDGTANGTNMVADTNDASITLNHSLNPRDIVSMGDRKIFFISGNAASGQELGYSDGTEAGTIVLDINTGLDGGYVKNVTRLGNKVVFTALDTTHLDNTQLWISDGTVAGTMMIKTLNTSAISAVSEIVAAAFDDTKLLIAVDDGVDGEELWITDGTESGTVLLKDINPDALSSNPEFF